jgi:LacI family transcriptional regulator
MGDPDPVVTIKTIADAAGVHPSTVSRALNPSEASRVGPETIRKVHRIAASLGYEPNPWARSLRTRTTLTIGLLLPRLTDPVLASMFESAEDRAREFGYQAVTVSSKDDPSEEQRLADLLLERRVDGLIFATCRMEDPLPVRIAERNTPFVLMNRASGHFPVVRSDDELGGYLATRHLIGLGHTRIGLIAGDLGVSTAAFRLRGYRAAHAEAGIAVDEKLLAPSTFSASGGISAAGHLLAMRDRPTAIVAVNDSTAVGVMSVARDLGLRVPEDLSVVGYNDDQLAALLPVPLTTVRVPLADIGRVAVDMLLARIRGESVESVVLPPSLVSRASSDRVR